MRAVSWRRRPVVLAVVGLAVLVVGYLAICGGGRRCRWRTTPGRARGPVVFLGDSITSGHGLPLEATFPALLGEADGLHPNAAGHARLAERLAPALRPLVGRR